MPRALSTRQLLRIARRLEAYRDEGVADAVYRASLAPFLPMLAKQSLDKV